jgi:hypothetical protein
MSTKTRKIGLGRVAHLQSRLINGTTYMFSLGLLRRRQDPRNVSRRDLTSRHLGQGMKCSTLLEQQGQEVKQQSARRHPDEHHRNREH